VDVTVEQTATSITVDPAEATVGKFETQAFTASVLDQFGAALTTQPQCVERQRRRRHRGGRHIHRGHRWRAIHVTAMSGA
jgi:hypothetical protein